MTAFVAVGAVLVLLVTLVLLLPLLRRRAAATEAADRADLAAWRDRLTELQQEHERGALSADDLQAATEELERELLQSRDDAEPAPPGDDHRPAGKTAVVVALAVPLCGIVLYLLTGQPGVLGGGEATLSPQRVEQLQSMSPQARIERLEDWLADNPGSARGWSLLAQSYRQTEAYGDAASAFARARAAGANDAWLIARQAETLLLANSRRFTRGVERLLEEALERDARNPLALMLSGQRAMVEGDPGRAADYWRRLAETLPEDAQQRGLIEQMVARAEEAARGAGEAGTDQPNAEGDAARIEVAVSLGSGMADAAEPDDTVFVFARRADGEGPPLAVARTRVDALPHRLVLDDGDAMSPEARLSGADKVTITARVSRSGQALPQSGDLQGNSKPVAVGAPGTVEVVIDRRLP